MSLTLTIRSGATPRVSLQMYSNASVNSASPARIATSSPYTCTCPILQSSQYPSKGGRGHRMMPAKTLSRS